MSSVWYHGTPDVRELEKEGGFTARNISVDYINDLDGYYDIQTKLKQSREAGDDKAYWKYLDIMSKFKAKFDMRKPIFLSNINSVARTYADDRRAFDYQNTKPKLLKVNVADGNVVTIVATGDRFRFISTDKVRRGFINSGISQNDIDEAIKKFAYYQKSDSGLKTDVVAVLGEWFGFDYVDVVGVLDSYEGGSIKSTVRMVFDPKNIKVLNMNENNKNLDESFEEYSNDALTDMIVNLSRYEGNEESIQRVKKELNRRKGISESDKKYGSKVFDPKSDKIPGGLADTKSVEDIAKKHDVSIDVINKAITKGVKVELEHTSDKDVAYEIAKDHIFENPKYYEGLAKMEKSLDETKLIIKKLIKEKVDLMITDETPDTISILVEFNDRNAGIIVVTSSPKDDKVLELVDMKFKEGYEELHIMKEALNGLWQLFNEINSIIVAPKPESIEFWNKMGFQRISPNYLISNRGH